MQQQQQQEPTAGASAAAAHGPAAAAEAPADELEPQLKYERLGADVKGILQGSSATCLCLSEKVLALGTSRGVIHILDYSGNEVKRFSLHHQPVRHISFDDKAEYVASCCGENYVSISSLYSDETNKFAFKRPITVVALEPRFASRKTREFVTGDVRGRLKLSSQGWLGRSDHVLHQGEGAIRAVAWHQCILVWANDVGVKVYDTNTHQFIGGISRPRGGRFADCCDCRLHLHPDDNTLYAAWPDAVTIAAISSATDSLSGAVSRRLHTTHSMRTDYFCMGAVPHGDDLAVLVYVTDADPDQNQVGLQGDEQTAAAATAPAAAAAAATAGGTGAQQQQQQSGQEPALSMSALPAPQQHKAAAGAAASSAAAEDDEAWLEQQVAEEDEQQQQPAHPDNAAADSVMQQEEVVPAAGGVDDDDGIGRSAASAAPISIPQPVRRPPRAANAVVRSPSGPSFLEAAAAAAVAGVAGAAGQQQQQQQPAPSPPAVSFVGGGSNAAAGGLPFGTPPGAGRPPLPGVGHSASNSRRESGSAAGSRRESGERGAAGGAAVSRSASVVSRGSAAAEQADTAYTPPGRPLRPELRILALAPHAHKPGSASTAAACSSSTCSEKAADALSVKGYRDYLPSQYCLVPSYGNEFALLSAAGASGEQQRRRRQQQGGSGSGKQQTQPQGAEAADAAAGSAAAAAGGGGGSSDGSTGAAGGTLSSSSEGVVEDFGEFMYFIVSPRDIVVGRHRDVEDRISWFLGARRFEAALTIAEADRGLSGDVWDTVVQAYLEYLTAAGKWGPAAAMLPRLLREAAPLWERWLYVFAQARQLPMLAPVLPTKQPQLHATCYDLVLQALLVDPAHHEQLLALVTAWPASCFHPPALIDAIAQRMQRAGGETRELWQALALLYRSQGRPDLSLAVYLQLQLPSVFEFIKEHSLLSYLDQKAYLLMAIDEERALELLAAHLDTLPPTAVVPSLLDALSAAEADGEDAQREIWRRRLFNYLHRVFQVDSSAGAEYAELSVHLYADYAPQLLMEFLQGSQTYPLEAALEVAAARGMVDEQVYILSRMGNCRAALALIIEQQQDIPRAIEFVRLQRDEELWEELIDWALRSADTTGQLLEHIGGNINPLRVIQKIPEGMAITRLRDRLRGIISDFRTQTSLREGCNAILRSDCLHLVSRLQREVRRAMPVVWLQRPAGAAHQPGCYHLLAAAAAGPGGGSGGGDGSGLLDSGGQQPNLELMTGLDAFSTTSVAKVGKGALAGRDRDAQHADSRRAGGPAGSAGGSKAATPAEASAAGSPVRLNAASSYLPPAAAAAKGPMWLRYCGGSGQAMAVVSVQDVPAAALEAAAAAGRHARISRSGTREGAAGAAPASLGSAASATVGTWIGPAHSSEPEGAFLADLPDAAVTLDGRDGGGGFQAAYQQQQLPQHGFGLTGAGQQLPSPSQQSQQRHRSSRHRRQRSSGQAALPSLVVG